ncbi:MAG: ATP-binding protein [Paludibacteraceae bacterium]|nr:ATP-binding protein [Paludibacteraceae bacterium]MBQ8020331.1 ATP-binding protein [Paludibacteraceae bacterium]MBR6111324.1 ATP-binding protein [Paludibacteraceae bacterium]
MAITKETFRVLIREGQEEVRDVEFFDRPFEFEENGRYVLVGVRQAGKSYMLYKRARQMMGKGCLLEDIIYINFDDERLMGMTADDFDLILQSYQSVYSGTPVFFFDEIQNVEGWEHFARRLANKKYLVYITGSNAKMLSRDIQTVLGGRFLDALIYPYTFAEYLAASGVALEKEWQYGGQRAVVQKLFADYMKWGGFPELLLFRNKRNWLNSLYDKILLGDIIQRNKVKNENALRLTMKRLAENVMQPISYNRIANVIRTTGTSIAVSSVSDYVRYAVDACMIFSLENYASKFVEKETVKKHYFVDNGLLSIFLLDGNTALLENLCAIHLHKKYGDKLYFYNKNIEVDFLVVDEGYAVQVSYSIYGDGKQETFDRETKALVQLDKYLSLNRMIIVTYDEEGVVTLDNGKQIEVIPVWKWLLE